MIHHLVSNDINYSILLVLLMKIVEICFSHVVSDQMIIELKESIKFHHLEFKRLFPNANFINKHHHMVHYPGIIEQKGPIASFNCLQKEAKHTLIKKQIAHSGNFINVPKSLVNKFCMKQSYSIQFATMKATKIDVLAFKNCEL